MSNTLNTPVEALETEFPLRVRELSVRRGSGGAGTHRGGDGIVRELEALEPMRFTLITERRRHPPRGRDGGADGAPGRNLLNGEPLPSKCEGELAAGRPAADRDSGRRRIRQDREGRIRFLASPSNRSDLAERIEIDGVTFAYEDTGGEGPAVLFLHGLGGSANGWLAQLEAAASGAGAGSLPTSAAPGEATPRPAPTRWSRGRRTPSGCSTRSGIERAALVGHSVGCMIAARAALRLGERTWGLALCGGATHWPQEAGAVFAERARLARAGRTDEIAEAVAATGLSERVPRSAIRACWA